MNRNEVFAFVFMIIILAVAVFFVQKSPEKSDPKPPNEQKNDTKYVWGVDSASYTDEDLYTCVRDEFGKPKVWGRYLGEIEGVSAGLDVDEVTYLHDQESHILIIYNHFSDATGYENGVEEAKKAISLAKDIDVPSGVAIFGDIEPNYPVDSDFIEGWYDMITDSDYEPGLYGVFNNNSDLITAYEDVSEQARDNTIIWTAYPQEGITTKEEAPSFNGKGPNNAMIYGWQYGLDAEECNIDTNVFKKNMINYLWVAD